MSRNLKIFIALQLVVVAVLVAFVFFKKSEVKGVRSNPIDKSNLVFDDSSLKYFYEPKPGDTIQQTPDTPSEDVRYAINSDTINSLKDFSETKSEGTIRIVTLGDSYTYGLFVNTEENYSSLLERMLNESNICSSPRNFEVINLGVPGYDTQYSYQRFIKRGLKYNPDLVIWFHLSLGRVSELTTPLTDNYYQEAKAKDPGKPDSELFNEAFLRARSEVINNIGEDNIYKSQAEIMQKLYSSHDGSILNLYFSEITAKEETVILESAKGRSNIFVSNLGDIYSKDGYFKTDRHPNALGHQLIAGDIFDYLKANKNVIGCS